MGAALKRRCIQEKVLCITNFFGEKNLFLDLENVRDWSYEIDHFCALKGVALLVTGYFHTGASSFLLSVRGCSLQGRWVTRTSHKFRL